MNKYTVKWLLSPSEIKNIYWEDIIHDTQETVNFEPNGDGKSRYLWACRKKDNRFVRVAKVIKNFVFLPLLFSFAEFLTLFSMVVIYLNKHSNDIVVCCLYGIIFLIFTHFMFNRDEKEKVEYWC